MFVYMLGPMKEKELIPGTVFPVLGTLLFFLPERYREKLCCVTPLTFKVTSHLHPHFGLVFFFSFLASHTLFVLVQQPKDTSTQPYQMAKKEGNGTAYCKEDTVTEEKEAASEKAQTTEEEDEAETRVIQPSCQLTSHTVQETAL